MNDDDITTSPLNNVTSEESGKLEENVGNNLSPHEIVDSPASTLSNVSPEREEEDEDMEEHLLYLRLMALKSMATDLTLDDDRTAESSLVNSPAQKESQSPAAPLEEDDELVNEMEELIDEADRAADEPQVVVQGSNSDSMNFQSVLQKIRQHSKQKSAETVVEDDVIIPTLEDVNSSPIAMEEDSDNEITIVEEVRGIKKPKRKSGKSGCIKIQDFARIKPRKDLLANPFQKQSDLQVNLTDDDVQIIDQPPNCETVNMDLSCENEAEIQFFKDQIDPEKQKDAIFPPSVWQIGDLLREPPPPPPPPLPSQPTSVRMRDVMNFSSDEARYDAFLRAVFDKNVSVAQAQHRLKSLDNRKRRRSEETRRIVDKVALPQATPTKRVRKENVEREVIEEVEDAEALRANILISMIEKRKQTESTKKKAAGDSVVAKTGSKINPELQKLGDRRIKMRHFPNLFKQVLVPMATSDDESEQVNQTTRALNTTEISEFSLNLDNFLKDVRQRTTTSDTKRKATPPPKPARKNPPGKIQPVKKSGPTFKKFPAAKSNSLLSVAIKTDLMTSTVSHLPPSEQAEYKKLKELIAKKEKAKLAQQPKSSTSQNLSAKLNIATAAVIQKVEENKVIAAATEPVATATKPVTAANKPVTVVVEPVATATKPVEVQEDDDEDPELMRCRLLASMKINKKPEQSNLGGKSLSTAVRKRITGPAPVEVTSGSQPALIVSFANTEHGARDVQVSNKLMNAPVKSATPVQKETKSSSPPVKGSISVQGKTPLEPAIKPIPTANASSSTVVKPPPKAAIKPIPTPIPTANASSSVVKPPLKSAIKPLTPPFTTANTPSPVLGNPPIKPTLPALSASKKIFNEHKPAQAKFPIVKAPDFIPFSSSSSVAAVEVPAPSTANISNQNKQTVAAIAHAEPSTTATLSLATVALDLLATTPSIPVAPVTPTPEELAKTEARELLKRKESEFGVIQRDMMQDTFKLSAQMSQLKGETNTLEEAESFAADLRRQLAETEQVITQKKSRITHLKCTVKTSTMEIIDKRRNMLKLEGECKMEGTELYGPIYKIPQTPGSQNIKKKLTQIKTMAENLLCNNESSRACPEVENLGPNSPTNANKHDISTDTISHVEAADINKVPQVAEPPTAVSSITTESNVLECISLAHLRTSQVSHLDPHKQLCRFELQGKCNDDLCKFQHYTPKPPQ